MEKTNYKFYFDHFKQKFNKKISTYWSFMQIVTWMASTLDVTFEYHCMWVRLISKGKLIILNIGPDGPELICHFANKFLYQKCWDTLCVSVCVCLVVCVKVLKEELKSRQTHPQHKANIPIASEITISETPPVSLLKPPMRNLDSPKMCLPLFTSFDSWASLWWAIDHKWPHLLCQVPS